MKITALAIITVLLTGCSTATGLLATVYDQNDPCQTVTVTRAENYQKPNWCGAASARRAIYNRNNQQIGYIR